MEEDEERAAGAARAYTHTADGKHEGRETVGGNGRACLHTDVGLGLFSRRGNGIENSNIPPDHPPSPHDMVVAVLVIVVRGRRCFSFNRPGVESRLGTRMAAVTVNNHARAYISALFVTSTSRIHGAETNTGQDDDGTSACLAFLSALCILSDDQPTRPNPIPSHLFVTSSELRAEPVTHNYKHSAIRPFVGNYL